MQTRDEVEGLHNYCQVFISGYVDYVNTEKKIFYCLYKLTLPRKKQQNSLLWHWLKEKFLQVAKSCTRNLARIINSCFAKKAAFQNTDFSRLKCQLKRKSWHITFGKIFQPTREWVNKVNLSSFQPKNFFKFLLSCSLRTADVSPCSSPLRDVSRWETSATQRQKFYTDVNHCLYNNPVVMGFQMQICSILRFSWSILEKCCVHLRMSSSKTQVLLLEKTIFHTYWLFC